MTLTQSQIDEIGQALNNAIGKAIDKPMRDRLWIDVNSKTGYSVGNTEMIAGLKDVIAKDTSPALGVYLAILTGGAAPAPPVVQPPAPAPTGATIPGLSASQIAGVIAACNAGIAANAWVMQRTRVKSELSQSPPAYTYGDPDMIESMKELVNYSAGAPAEVISYLKIIDQRDGNNQPLPKGDPRWKYVGGAQPAPPPPPAAGAEIPPDLRSALEGMGFEFASNGQLSGFRLISTGAPEGPFYATVAAADAGLRLLSGLRVKIGSSWPEVDRNPNLPMIFGPVIERDGGVSWDYEPPITGSDPNPRPRKTFIMYLAGFLKGTGPRKKNAVGKFLDFCSFEAGRGWRFNTFPQGGSEYGDISTALQLDADNPDAAVIRVGNQLRRIVLGADGTLRAGEVVDEYQ